jgi:hypothetical protein
MDTDELPHPFILIRIVESVPLIYIVESLGNLFQSSLIVQEREQFMCSVFVLLWMLPPIS